MTSIALTLHLTHYQFNSVNKEVVLNVLKQISPEARIPRFENGLEYKFTIILENKSMAKMAVELIHQSLPGIGELSTTLIAKVSDKDWTNYKNGKFMSNILKSKPNTINDLFHIIDDRVTNEESIKIIESNSTPVIVNRNKYQNFLNHKSIMQKKNTMGIGQSTQYNNYKQFEMKNQFINNQQNMNADSNRGNVTDIFDHKLNKKFIKIKNFDKDNINAAILFNLLGVIGNVTKMLYDMKKGLAIAEMKNPEQAELAQQYLNGIAFFNTILDISIYEPGIKWTETFISSDSDMKIIDGNWKYYRYKPNLKIKINKLSKLLHVTNVSSNITLNDLYKLVSDVCEPNSIRKLGSKGKKSSMYLIEFQSEKDSLEVLATYHDRLVGELRLKMSFSHMKIA